jgi:hypothetical protein
MIKNREITTYNEFCFDTFFNYDSEINIFLNCEIRHQLKENLNREMDGELNSVLYEVTNYDRKS